MTKKLTALLLAMCATSVNAQQSPVDLAVESYKFIVSYESMLQGAINSGSKADYNRFIWKPALEQFQKWPPLSNEVFAKYRACQWAVDSFRVYSQDQFNAGGKLDKAHSQYRDFIGRKRDCASALKGKV